jgi:hypothetical protein
MKLKKIKQNQTNVNIHVIKILIFACERKIDIKQ